MNECLFAVKRVIISNTRYCSQLFNATKHEAW